MNTLMIGALLAQLMVRPWSQTNEPLEARVARDFEKTPHAEAFVHYAVPPMSDVQRLKDVYPYDGKAGGTVKIIMAKDEYEPGSFLVWGLKDLGKTHFSLSVFKNEKGDVLPAKALKAAHAFKASGVLTDQSRQAFEWTKQIKGLELVP